MFTLCVHEIEIVATTFYKTLVQVASLNRNWQTIPKLTSIIHKTLFCKIQCLVSTVLMTCCYLTLENNENLEQTETCHLNIQVHCQIDVILNASCCISASYEKTSVSNNNYQ